MHCPHCTKEIEVYPVAELAPFQVETVIIAPANGHVEVRELAATLFAFSESIEQTAKRLGGDMLALVNGIEYGPNGSVKVKMMLCATKNDKPTE